MANWPTFNPQNLEDSTNELRRNRCVTDPYEPGSTLKPFIVGPALQAKVTRLNEVWPIHGISWHTPYGRKVTDVHAYGPLATWDGLVKSSNICMSMLAERMGNPLLQKSLTSFQFGRPTGIELPGEDPGRVNPLKQWNKFSTESVAQGYEMMVTPLQLARGFCAYANGGRLVQPTIVRGVLDSDGQIISKRKADALELLPEVIRPETAAEMRRVLCDTVVRGTATKARDDTWNIFGKTGTAHISQGKGGYSLTRFTSSFMAGAPAENPRLVVAFIVHEPNADIAHYGGTVSGPGAANLLRRSLAYLQVPASPELSPPPASVTNVLVNFNPKVYQRKQVAEAR
jgi:cell division protein FtsI (penicillin-binding protein 3)